jgi:hypothetical protein
MPKDGARSRACSFPARASTVLAGSGCGAPEKCEARGLADQAIGVVGRGLARHATIILTGTVACLRAQFKAVVCLARIRGHVILSFPMPAWGEGATLGVGMRPLVRPAPAPLGGCR